MNITLYVNESEVNKVDKTLTTKATLSGTLREESSIIDPVITFTNPMSAADMVTCNYMYIQEFERYYFIRNIESVRNGVWRVSAHVDVLMSFADGIKSQKAVVARQENKYNLYLDDRLMKMYQDPYVVTKAFPNGLTENEVIFMTAGANVIV